MTNQFFDRFRQAVARLPAGLVRVMPPASPEAIARAEEALGAPLPAEYASFLRSFDGADLFHEAILLAGVGPAAPRALVDLNPARPAPLLAIADGAAGDRFALDGDGRVWRLRAGSDEKSLSGSSFARWLDATVAREQLLYGPDGEFAPDLFEDDGEEVRPVIALRQAERALRADPGSADAEHERGVALRRLGRADGARAAFAAAAALDPDNPWPWFDLGRAELATGRAAEALEAFGRAAAHEPGAGGARLFAWAARAALAAGDRAAADEARRSALARDPELAEGLRRAREQAAAGGDESATAEAEALLDAVTGARRLPVVRDPHPHPSPLPEGAGIKEGAARPRPPGGPRRPRRGRPRRGGASRPGSRR
jgi:tetratricopeptide (TPR) repeat protein